jgi:acyltransferase
LTTESNISTSVKASVSHSRVHWIDIAKGLAILCVFIGHTDIVTWQARDFIYSFHMPVFFFLSGYCFSNRRAFKDFVLNKARTILIPAFAVGILGRIIISVVSKILYDAPINYKAIILSPILQCGKYNFLWFFPTLFVLMLIFYGLTKLLKEHYWAILVVSVIFAAASYLCIYFFKINAPWFIDRALIVLPFFSAGYVFKKKRLACLFRTFLIFPASFLICAVISFINTKSFSFVDIHLNLYGNIFLFYAAAFAGIAMIISLSMKISANRVLEFCGRNTLLFYAFEPFQKLANEINKDIGTQIPLGNIFVSVPVTALTVTAIAICSGIFAMIINKYFPWLLGKKKEKAL